jgi:alkanesulfonate monooxygenase
VDDGDRAGGGDATDRFLVAVRPGFISTGVFAQMAAALDQISDGRLDLNVVPGGIQGDFERLGVTMDHDKRYQQAEEFIAALRALWAKPEPVVFEGSTIRLKGAVVSPGPVGDAPRFYVGGASTRALQFTAREADAYLAWIQPVDDIRASWSGCEAPAVHGTASFPRAADAPGRTAHRARGVAGGGRAHDAGGRARRCPAPDGVRRYPDGRPAGAGPGARAGEGARLWNGISRVRVNLGTAIIGDPAQVNVASVVLPGLREAIRRES